VGSNAESRRQSTSNIATFRASRFWPAKNLRRLGRSPVAIEFRSSGVILRPIKADVTSRRSPTIQFLASVWVKRLNGRPASYLVPATGSDRYSKILSPPPMRATWRANKTMGKAFTGFCNVRGQVPR
jgi:hypothetical protein